MTSQTYRDSQIALLEHNFEYQRRKDECPVCHWDLKSEQSEEFPKTYWYKDKEYPCPDNDYGHVMYLLAKQYWLAFIPIEYQTLLWEEFPYPELRKDIDNYIDNNIYFNDNDNRCSYNYNNNNNSNNYNFNNRYNFNNNYTFNNIDNYISDW